MSISLRFFLFAPEGLRRISQRLVSALTDGEEAMPQYAGKKLKLAQVVVSLAGGKVAQIVKIYGAYFDFDESGKVDETFRLAARDAMETLEAYERFERSKSSKIVSLAPKLRHQKYEREHRWEPSRREIDLISQALFKSA
jgi:hypothetical protein